MSKLEFKSGLKQLQNRYRLTIMNDDTYEEVVTFRLSRMSVYVAASTLFIVITALTVALIVFTPLKQYLPGYGSMRALGELQSLKVKTDSIEKELAAKDLYLLNLKKMLSGNSLPPTDTTVRTDLKSDEHFTQKKNRKRRRG